jgi:hypothetical protein
MTDGKTATMKIDEDGVFLAWAAVAPGWRAVEI